MNGTQKFIVVSAAAALFFACLFPPWMDPVTGAHLGYFGLFPGGPSGPTIGRSIDLKHIAVEIILVAVAASGLFFAYAEKRPH